VSCAPPVVTSPPVLRPDWEILARLAFTWSKPLYLDACPTLSHPPVGLVAQPTNRSLLDFKAQTKKPSQWFWEPNHQTVATSFEAQIEKPYTTLVLRLNQETVATDFEVKPEKPSQWFWGQTTNKMFQWFWGQTANKPSILVLRLNQKTRAPHLHVHGADCTRVTQPLDRPATEYSTCVTIPGPLHQVSNSCHDPRCYPLCRTCHLHTTRQANAIL
jgi:hypothetical protein